MYHLLDTFLNIPLSSFDVYSNIDYLFFLSVYFATHNFESHKFVKPDENLVYYAIH